MTEDELAVLDFEKEWQRARPGSGVKEQAIYYRFGVSATRYYQRLNVLLDSQAALEHDPHTVNRLRRIRAARLRSRRQR